MASTSAIRSVVRRTTAQTSSKLAKRAYATPAAYKGEEVDPQLNGYPQLPNVSRQYLPPKGWWDTQMRRNFEDTLHEREELYSMWGPDIPVVPPQRAAVHFAIAVAAFVGFGYAAKNYFVAEKPAVPREYPYSGLVAELGGLEENKAQPETESDEE